MAKKGPKTDQQFIYWDLRRKGLTQSEIARRYDITRQAVNKSMKLQEREAMFRLLDAAQTSGVLVEWYDARRGLLLGVTPQLGNLACIMIIDDKNKVRLFYDQDKNRVRNERRRIMSDLLGSLGSSLGLKMSSDAKFKEIMKELYKGH